MSTNIKAKGDLPRPLEARDGSDTDLTIPIILIRVSWTIIAVSPKATYWV